MLPESALQKMETLLRGCDNEEAMNLEMLDGFFVACVIGPDIISPDEYLPAVMGSPLDATALAPEDLAELVGLLFAHWDAVSNDFIERGQHLPILFVGEDGSGVATDWCLGFLAGTQLREDAWMQALEDEELSLYMTPILALAADGIAQQSLDDAPDQLASAAQIIAPLEPSAPITYKPADDDDEEEEDTPLTADERVQMIDSIAVAVGALYQHFRQVTDAPQLLGQTKVGRNQPCPCGSGKKWKHCCANPARKVH